MILSSDSYIVRHRIRVVFCCCGSWKCQIVDVVVIFITFSVKTVQCSVSTRTSSREDRLVKTFCLVYQYLFTFIILILFKSISMMMMSLLKITLLMSIFFLTRTFSAPMLSSRTSGTRRGMTQMIHDTYLLLTVKMRCCKLSIK